MILPWEVQAARPEYPEPRTRLSQSGIQRAGAAGEWAEANPRGKMRALKFDEMEMAYLCSDPIQPLLPEPSLYGSAVVRGREPDSPTDSRRPHTLHPYEVLEE